MQKIAIRMGEMKIVNFFMNVYNAQQLNPIKLSSLYPNLAQN